MDRNKISAFADRFVNIAAGATTMGLLAVADRSGLSAYLGEFPTGTADEIADGAGLDQRYVLEILSGLAAAGVVEYESEGQAFTLPPEHALFISTELSPYFVGGWFDLLPSAMAQIDGITVATREGGGVAFDEYANIVEGVDRGNGPSQRALLTTKWLPAIEGMADLLNEGARVADVGCGAGTAALIMAQAYPNSQIVGFDVSEESISLAASRAEGIQNVEFHVSGAEEIPTEPGFDLITTFDVIHDLVDPLAGMTRIRNALTPGGRYLMMEPNASSDLEDNLHDRGALLYGISALHCMTQSLAHGGAGLGTAWGSRRAEQMARQAGFGSFEPLDSITNRFSAFYLLSP